MIKIKNPQFEVTNNAKSFGFLDNGMEIFRYQIINKNGFACDVINFGATITSLKIPISDSETIDVVLGFENMDGYLKSFRLDQAPYFGSIVGRFAGRISNAQFSIDNQQINLEKNQGNHHIHGGSVGFSQVYWELKELTKNSITLQYISVDHQDNYPGKVNTIVQYTWSDNNELIVEMQATSTKDTLLNLTQHSYFNLDGHAHHVENQFLKINASKILALNIENIPIGHFIDLNQHHYDFRIPKKCPGKIDNTFVIDNNEEVVATLISYKNNLKMEVFTNQPAVHVYIGGNCFNQLKGKENANYHSFSGICFETQNFPDAPNHEVFPNAFLRKGETYLHQTIFKFENL
jgi:aldose 1-epimerase